jgi:hypothetical protein
MSFICVAQSITVSFILLITTKFMCHGGALSFLESIIMPSLIMPMHLDRPAILESVITVDRCIWLFFAGNVHTQAFLAFLMLAMWFKAYAKLVICVAVDVVFILVVFLMKACSHW